MKRSSEQRTTKKKKKIETAKKRREIRGFCALKPKIVVAAIMKGSCTAATTESLQKVETADDSSCTDYGKDGWLSGWGDTKWNGIKEEIEKGDLDWRWVSKQDLGSVCLGQYTANVQTVTTQMVITMMKMKF